MSVIKSFPDRYINRIATTLMLDNEINKMLYYNDVCDKDIYKLPIVKNPITELKDVKVFCNRRVEKLYMTSDITMFVNLRKDSPYSKNAKKSTFVESLNLEIGVICHDGCRKTLNGARESIVFDRIQQILKEDENLEAIGKPIVTSTDQIYNIPLDYNGYVVAVQIDYFSTMQ